MIPDMESTRIRNDQSARRDCPKAVRSNEEKAGRDLLSSGLAVVYELNV